MCKLFVLPDRRAISIMSTSVFHPFPRLPQELRLDIWQKALPDPRIIELRFMYLNDQNITDWRDWHCPTQEWVASSTSLSRSLFRANKEAREVFLKAYKIMDVVSDEPGQSRASTIEVDYERDVFYVTANIPERSNSPATELLHDQTMWFKRLKRVAVDLTIMQKGFYRQLGIYTGFAAFKFDPSARALGVVEDALAMFPALEQLYFTVDTATGTSRLLVDLMDSEEYTRWYQAHSLQIPPEWIPGVATAINSKRDQSNPLEIALKILIDLPGSS